MSTLLINIGYGLLMAAIGVGIAWVCCAIKIRRISRASQEEVARMRNTMAVLQTWTFRVSADVNEHSSQVEKINQELRSDVDPEADAVVAKIAEIVHVNERMQKRLKDAETKLQEQAKIIEFQAAEVRTDPLTRVTNRRGFEEEIARRFAEFKRHRVPFCILLLDLDHFKRLNDKHGHQAGDACLRQVAAVLRQTMRQIDVVARYGGEEFGVVLPHTSVVDALVPAERARMAIEESKFRFQKKELPITASFGIADLQVGENLFSLLRRADEAVYASKKAGRNKTFWHDSKTVRPAGDAPASEPAPDATDGKSPQEPKQRPAPEEKKAGTRCNRQAKTGSGNKQGENDKSKDRAKPESAQELERQPSPAAAEANDDLDRLSSRTEFFQTVRRRLAEWKRGGFVFSVILLKLCKCRKDDGQPDRDLLRATLETLAKSAATFVREMDLVARYDSVCFAFLLPGLDNTEAESVGRRIWQAAEQSIVSHNGQEEFKIRMGLALVSGEDDSFRLLQRAEEALRSAEESPDKPFFFHTGQGAQPVLAGEFADRV